MPVNSVHQNQVKHNFKPHGGKHGASRTPDHVKNKPQEEKPAKTNAQDSLVIEKVTNGLSDKAAAYLETLKEKFGDMNFIVGDRTDSTASSNGKAYNCFISADLLERMASCKKTAKAYEGIIKEAVKQVDTLKQIVEEKGLAKHVKSYNVKVNNDGTIDYMVALNGAIQSPSDNRMVQGRLIGSPLSSFRSVSYDQFGRPSTMAASDIKSLVGMLEAHDKAPKGAQWVNFMNSAHSAHHHKCCAHHGKPPHGPAFQKMGFLMPRQPLMLMPFRPIMVMSPIMIARPIQMLKPGFIPPPQKQYGGMILNTNKTYTAKHMSKFLGGLRQAQNGGFMQTGRPGKGAPVPAPAHGKGRGHSHSVAPGNSAKINSYGKNSRPAITDIPQRANGGGGHHGHNKGAKNISKKVDVLG